MSELRTERLILRDWHSCDEQPWAELNADPAVREFLGPLLKPEQALASLRRFQRDLDRDGIGFRALEVQATGEFIGFAGLDRVEDGLPISGVEIGWRLARSAWGRGYATEAAWACLEQGFDELGLTEILAVTAAGNRRSQAVMGRLGLIYDPASDFEDADVAEPIRRQVVYRKHR